MINDKFLTEGCFKSPLTPEGRTERKENVWDTFLAIGPAGALGFVK